MPDVLLPPKLRRRLLDHLETVRPDEGCGILLGVRTAGAARVEEVWATANVADRPDCRYEIPLEELFSAHRRAREQSREVLGYFHSHPRGSAIPSTVDRERAWDGMRQVIVAWADGVPELRCWRFAPNPVEESLRW